MKTALRILAGRVQEKQWPLLPCPGCSGNLAVETVEEFESGGSRKAREHEAWDPEWIEGRFVSVPRCGGCGTSVVVAGDYKVVFVATLDGGDFQELHGIFYTVRATSPGLRIIDVPDRAPNVIKELIKETAAILWQSPLAAANTLRRAVEAMLDDLKVNKTLLTKKGARARLTTHGRIELLQMKRPDVADGLMAVKWVGNSGSHEVKTLTVPQVLEAADMFAYALRLVYDDYDQMVKRRIAQTNRAKKPVAARSGRGRSCDARDGK